MKSIDRSRIMAFDVNDKSHRKQCHRILQHAACNNNDTRWSNNVGHYDGFDVGLPHHVCGQWLSACWLAWLGWTHRNDADAQHKHANDAFHFKFKHDGFFFFCFIRLSVLFHWPLEWPLSNTVYNTIASCTLALLCAASFNVCILCVFSKWPSPNRRDSKRGQSFMRMQCISAVYIEYATAILPIISI